MGLRLNGVKVRQTPSQGPGVATKPLTASDQTVYTSRTTPFQQHAEKGDSTYSPVGHPGSRSSPQTLPDHNPNPLPSCYTSHQTLGLGPFLLPTWTSLPTLSSGECLPILKTCWTTLGKVSVAVADIPHLLCELLTLRIDTALPAFVPQNLEQCKTHH